MIGSRIILPLTKHRIVGQYVEQRGYGPDWHETYNGEPEREIEYILRDVYFFDRVRRE